jgi:hypothetical protein
LKWRKRSVLEKQIEQYLNKRVKELNGLTFKWISTVTGVPDRIVILNNQIYLVELKTPTGVVSERQRLVFKQLEEHGQTVHILKSKSDVENFIDETIKP